MDLITYAINDSVLEGMIRGLRFSFLTEDNYQQMSKNCNNIIEMKQYLEEETDYAQYLQDEHQAPTMNQLKLIFRKKLADEIAYFENNAVYPLNKFLFFIRCKYMIDNVVSIIEGLKNKVDPASLEANADPLGHFPEMKTIKVEADDFASLYSTVLIDTAIGQYFIKFIDQSMKDLKTPQDIQAFFKETKPEILRTSLKRIWLEDFLTFCESLNPTSSDHLKDLINTEADFRTIQVVWNSFANERDGSGNQVGKATRVSWRKPLVSPFGYLYPDYMRQLIECDNFDLMKTILRPFNNYFRMVKNLPDPTKSDEHNVQTKSFEDFLYDEEMKMYSRAFDTLGSYGIYYAYIKLKEQEIRNLLWIGEMITRNQSKQSPSWGKIIIPFSNMKQNNSDFE